MKKAITVLLVLVLLTFCATAMAAGKLQVTQENFHTIMGYRLYSYAYARVENVGDKPIAINAGLLEIYDEAGDALTSTDYVNAYARYLQPGEYTYAYMYDEIENESSPDVVDDYLLTLTGKSDKDNTTLRLPCVVEYKEDVDLGYSTYDYIYITITNDTDEPVFDIKIVAALLDEEDNILHIDSDYLGSNMALLPGSSIFMELRIDDNFTEYFKQNGFDPVKADVIVYTYLEN